MGEQARIVDCSAEDSSHSVLRVVEARTSEDKDIGAAILEEMGKQALTTTELAEKVGISQAQISRLQTGKQGFRSSTLRRIAKALGVVVRVNYGQ